MRLQLGFAGIPALALSLGMVFTGSNSFARTSATKTQEKSVKKNATVAKKKAKKKKEKKRMFAVFETSKGNFKVELFQDKAPKTVENFVELAKGAKEWTDPKTGDKVKKPLYDGTIFHRVIPKFMIQGGDPLGNGTGGPGYRFADEFDDSLTFAKPGMLAMANAGPNTNGSQFFVTVAPTPWLNHHHTIFGEVVEGYSVVEEISNVSTNPSNNKPLEDVVLKKIKIEEK